MQRHRASVSRKGFLAVITTSTVDDRCESGRVYDRRSVRIQGVPSRASRLGGGFVRPQAEVSTAHEVRILAALNAPQFISPPAAPSPDRCVTHASQEPRTRASTGQ